MIDAVPVKPKLEAVCRAEGWGEWSRSAVRMTAKGSVTPWMACGSRPVEGSPALGSFPDSRHTPRPGIAKGPNRGLDGIDYPGPDLARGQG